MLFRFLSVLVPALIISMTAVAADLAPVKPNQEQPQAFIWTGVYAGLNAGGTWGNYNSTNISIWPTKNLSGYWETSSLLAGGLATGGASGLIAGGQFGYNRQYSFASYNLLAGIETDMQGIASNKGSGQSPMSAAALSFTGHSQFATYSTTAANNYLSYIGTVRGRVGFLATPSLLIYGTGGFAYGQANLSLNQFQQFGIAVGWSDSTNSATQVGWTAGGGLEWMFAPNWSIKAEYLYYDLGNQSTQNQFFALSPSGVQWTYGSYASRPLNGNIVRAGVNYHVNFVSAPIIAKF